MNNLAYKRALLKIVKKQFKGAIIADHQLRVEQPINNQTNTYEMKVLEDTMLGIKTEIKLNKNDLFLCTGIGLAVYNRKNTNDANASTETVEPLQTYGNESYFGAATANFDPKHLEFVYKGHITLKVGSTIYIPQLSTDKFKFVPQTQQSAATNRSQYNNEEIIKDLTAHYKIRGTDQVEFNLNVKTFTGIKAAADTTAVPNSENRVVLLLDGFLIKGGANLVETKISED